MVGITIIRSVFKPFVFESLKCLRGVKLIIDDEAGHCTSAAFGIYDDRFKHSVFHHQELRVYDCHFP